MFLQKKYLQNYYSKWKIKKKIKISKKKKKTDGSRTKFLSMYKMDYKYCVAV